MPSRATEHEYPSYLRVSSFERVSAAADKQFPDADARDKSAEELLWGITPPVLTRVVVKRILRERIQGYGLTWKRIAAGFMYQEDGGSGRLSPSASRWEARLNSRFEKQPPSRQRWQRAKLPSKLSSKTHRGIISFRCAKSLKDVNCDIEKVLIL